MNRNVSPLFTFTIDSTGTWIAPLHKMPYAKYVPFNHITITNKDTSDVTLTINGSIKKLVPAGTIITLTPPEVMAIRDVRIDGIATAGTIEVSIMKAPTIWDAIQKIAGRWF